MTHTIELLPKQMAFLRSNAPEVLYSGSVRAGKTFALVLKTVMRAATPGAREALVRKHNSTLKPTTLTTLLEGDGMNPPVLAPGSYEWRRADQAIRIHGGGEIVYFGLDDVQKIGSRSLTGVNIDETIELSEKDYQMLQTRVSVDVPGLVKQLNGACNPGPPGHFLARKFGLAPGQTCEEGCEVFQTHSAENWYLSAEYLERIEKLTGSMYERLVRGRWVGSEGVIYDTWYRPTHVVERKASDMRRWIGGSDDGYANPFTFLLIGIDGDGRRHVYRSTARSGLRNAEKIGLVRETIADAGLTERDLERYPVDAAAAQLIDEMQAAGLPAEKAEKDVLDGIQVVQANLGVRGDGTPGLTVDPSCRDLIEEFESYEWVERSGQRLDLPKKANDHSLDALRYALMSVRNATLQLF